MKTLHVTVASGERDLFTPILAILNKKVKIDVETSERPVDGCVNLGTVQYVKAHPGCARYLEENNLNNNWELIYKMENEGYIVSGESLGRINCAFIYLVDQIVRNKADVISTIRYSVFNRYYLSFDDCSFGFSRAADDFDLSWHLLEVLRMGIENFEINRIHDDVPIQIRERSVWYDQYPWWHTYMPALDMFYESSLTRGTYSEKMLKENRKVLCDTADLVRKLGLKPIYTVFEPRAWPDRLFRKYPSLRGARVDHPAYSCEPEYAPDINHPLVLKHYRELVRQLMKDVPDLDLFDVWAQDSNAGFPWAQRLYAGPNGPIGIRKKPVWSSVNRFLSALKDEISKFNKATRVHINISWVFSNEEKEEIAAHIQDDIGISFDFSRFAGEENTREDEWTMLQKYGHRDAQALRQGIGCNWKRYAPLMGFPFPGRTRDALHALFESGISNISMRGGIVSPVFVPYSINNEVIQAYKYAGGQLNLNQLLRRCAKAWTKNSEETDLLLKVWTLCDHFDALYAKSNVHGYTSMFVSSRTLFRKLVRPIVPDHSFLDHSETRYYMPHVFLTHADDPSWHDISYFNFEQVSSDAAMIQAVEHIDHELMPLLTQCLDVLNQAGCECSEVISDTHVRVLCFYLITQTERALLDTQVAIHEYMKTEDSDIKKRQLTRIRGNMMENIKTTKQFACLLKSTKYTLIPVTSGEETPFMFKAPLYHLLQKKIMVMENHMDDLPGPVIKDGYLGK
jgi:hypothetical protein